MAHGTRKINRRRAALGSLFVGVGTLFLGGCSTNDSFLNPSITGRWERTPTRVPILEHLAAIEDPDDQWVEISNITNEDLVVRNTAYRISAGDAVTLTVWDLVIPDQPEVLPQTVAPDGYVQIPQIGRVFVAGLTEQETAQAIEDRMRALVADPLVSVVVQNRREQTFHVSGSIANPGAYVIPGADYRLLQGLTAAGGPPAFIQDIFVIRQVPLESGADQIAPLPGDEGGARDDRTRQNGAGRADDAGDPEGETDGEDLLDVIDDLSSPGMVSGTRGSLVAPPSGDEREPMIDLIERSPDQRSGNGSGGDTDGTGEDPRSASGVPAPRWRFVDGEWRRERVPMTDGRRIERAGETGPRDGLGQLFTQRVIRIPTQPLLAGDARYNMVIRPGDVIRIPPNPVGNVYIDGQVVQPGVFNLPAIGRLTLTRAITSAGGLNGIAVPERIDLTRVVGNNEQATIMLNLRAIAEGTQPDVYIKPDDRINVGTNFWATPLAVLRGGFRINYGFGFLLDRNFGNDVFGAPPTNRGF